MKIVQDDLWLCDDCVMYAVNGDLTGIDYSYSGDEAEKRAKQVVRGVNALGPHLVPDFDSETGEGMEEFSRTTCAGCGTHLAGGRHRFAVFGPDTKKKRLTKEGEQRAMRTILKRRKYDPEYAVILQQAGMSPEELERIVESANGERELERLLGIRGIGIYTGKRR